MSQRRKLFLVAALALCALFLLPGCSSGKLVAQRQVEGRVVDKYTHFVKIRYHYLTIQAENYTATFHVGRSTYAYYEIGDPVLVCIQTRLQDNGTRTTKLTSACKFKNRS